MRNVQLRKQMRRRLNSNQANKSAPLNTSKVDISSLCSRLTLVGGVISLMTVVLMLVGYGYTLGLATSFGYDASDIYRSPIDFLLASSQPLGNVFNLLYSEDGFGKLNSHFSKNELWQYVAIAILLYFIIDVGSWLLVKYPKVMIYRSKLSLKNVWIWFQRSCIIGRYVMVGFSGIGVAYTSLSFVYLALLLVLLSIMILPAIGYSNRRNVAVNEIISDDVQCAAYQTVLPKVGNSQAKLSSSPKEAEGRNQTKKSVMCLAVIKDGRLIARGRRITTNSDQLFLYARVKKYTTDGKLKQTLMIPKTVPLKDVIVEQADTDEWPERGLEKDEGNSK